MLPRAAHAGDKPIFRNRDRDVLMYYRDHEPPHFHARYGENEAAVSIASGEVIAGRLPGHILKLINEWRRCHVAELNMDWLLCRARNTLKRIAPWE